MIYIVLWVDRHVDPSVHPFSDREKAIAYAREMARKYDRHGDYNETEISPGMKKQGVVFNCHYSCESDYLSVIEAEVKQ